MSKAEAMKVVDDLVQLMGGAQTGFSDVARRASDLRLKIEFRKLAAAAAKNAERLKRHLDDASQAGFDENDSLPGSQGWISLRSSSSDRNIQALEEVERAQHHASWAFTRALKTSLEGSALADVRRLAGEHAASRNHIRNLRYSYCLSKRQAPGTENDPTKAAPSYMDAASHRFQRLAVGG